MSVALAQVVDLAEVRALDKSVNVGEIVVRAENRARERGIAYRGLLTPDEAWSLLQEEVQARLVDVRTNEELNLIGRVPNALEIPWKLYPDWRLNPEFLAAVKAQFAPGDRILLLCRSGVRSREAAEFLAENGFRNCFNVLEGFEGDKNSASQRIMAGWKARGLPWSH